MKIKLFNFVEKVLVAPVSQLSIMITREKVKLEQVRKSKFFKKSTFSFETTTKAAGRIF